MDDCIENKVFAFCMRLRELRKFFNFTVNDLSLRTGLTFAQIRRLEGTITQKNNKIIKSGANGTASTLIVLLLYYSQRISIDMLLNFTIPVNEIPIDKGVEKDITREKLINLIGEIHDVLKFLE